MAIPLSPPEAVYQRAYQAMGRSTPDAIAAALEPVPNWYIRRTLGDAAASLTRVRQGGADAASFGVGFVDAQRLEQRLEESRLLLSELARRLVVLMATYGKGWARVPRDIRRYIDRDEKDLRAMTKALNALHHSLMLAVAAGSDPDGRRSREVRQRLESMASAIQRLADSDRPF